MIIEEVKHEIYGGIKMGAQIVNEDIVEVEKFKEWLGDKELCVLFHANGTYEIVPYNCAVCNPKGDKSGN